MERNIYRQKLHKPVSGNDARMAQGPECASEIIMASYLVMQVYLLGVKKKWLKNLGCIFFFVYLSQLIKIKS